MNNIRVIYIGLHPDTLIYINKAPFTVVAVSYLDFLAKPTFNPVNALFAFGYTLHTKKWSKVFVRAVFFLWNFFNFFSSDFYIRYGAYIKHIIENNILIIKETDADTIEMAIRTYKIDIMVINSWSILSKKIINMPPLGTINVHPSKLPKYRGALPTLWALKNKDSSTAVSLIKLLPGIDDGPLLSQREFPILTDDNAIDLEHKIDDILRECLWDDLTKYVQKIKLPMPQSGESSATDKYMAYREINWEYEKAKDIINKILLYPYIEPRLYVYTYVLGRRIHFKNAKLENISTLSHPGEFTFKNRFLYIKSASESIRVRLFRDISILDSFFIMRNKKKLMANV